MELLYEMRYPGGDGRQTPKRISSEGKATCALSLKNLIAFTSHADLLVKRTNRLTNSLAAETSGTHVYVADLNTPWDCYLVKNSTVEVSNLNWSNKGQLLIATEVGIVEIYEMQDNLLNKWSLVYEGLFPGEPILASCWLQFPKKVCLNPDKLDSMLYSEKYDIRQMPSKKGFGGKSLDGCLLVTATGLLAAIVRSSDDSSKIATSVEKIIAIRNRITCTDMAYSKDGNIVIVSSGSKVKQPVQLNRVSVKLVGGRDKAEIKVTASQSLFLQNVPDHDITAVKFGCRSNPDVLLIALHNKDTHSSILYLYELVNQPVVLKARFHTTNELIPTFRWNQSAQVQFNSSVEELCTVALPITTAASSMSSAQHQPQQQPSYNNQSVNALIQPLVAVSLGNGTIHLVRYDNLQQVGMLNGRNMNFAMKRERDEPPEAKQMKMNGTSPMMNTFVSMQFSWSGSILVGLNAHSAFSVFRMYANIDASTATSLIELSMVGGRDPWDVMMCVRQNLIENIVDRLSETFARQPPPVQCYYNVKILVVKAALYRLACGGLARSNDQQTLLTLNLVSGALKALLRPSGLSSLDKGPAEALSALLSSKGESLSDVDQVLIHSEAKEYTVEPSTLQSLQQILQWCADLALKLLATLPDLRHSRAPGWEVCRDSKAVGTLRELIVLMRIWGLIRKSCLPSFRRTSENVDILPQLFRLLTRLSVAPHDPDEMLIDHFAANRFMPEQQQVKAEPKSDHYIFLWLSLGFAGVFVIGLVIGYFCKCNRSKQEQPPPEDEEFANKNSSGGGGLPRQRVLSTNRNPISVKTSPVQPQPKSSSSPTKKDLASDYDLDFASSAPPIHDSTLPYNLSSSVSQSRGRPMSFGPYRSVSQQITDFEETLLMDNEYEAERARRESLARKASLLLARQDSLDPQQLQQQGLINSSSSSSINQQQHPHRKSSAGLESLRSFRDYLSLTSSISFLRESIDEADDEMLVTPEALPPAFLTLLEETKDEQPTGIITPTTTTTTTATDTDPHANPTNPAVPPGENNNSSTAVTVAAAVDGINNNIENRSLLSLNHSSTNTTNNNNNNVELTNCVVSTSPTTISTTTTTNTTATSNINANLHESPTSSSSQSQTTASITTNTNSKVDPHADDDK